VGLPTLRAKRRAGVPEDVARLDALLGIMSQLVDTCVLHRGGQGALLAVYQGAGAVVTAGGYETATGRRHFEKLDSRLRSLGISPGGSADLLAATLFVDAVEGHKTAVPADQNQPNDAKWKRLN
jgi:triphosphoribosyl-dephospho-CoA synthase